MINSRQFDQEVNYTNLCLPGGPAKQTADQIMTSIKIPWGTPYNGLYKEALPERGNYFGRQVYRRGKGFHESRYMKG